MCVGRLGLYVFAFCVLLWVGITIMGDQQYFGLNLCYAEVLIGFIIGFRFMMLANIVYSNSDWTCLCTLEL